MGLKHGDLKDTVISRISIDEFEPKTGDSKDVVVVGIRVTEQSVGQDLYNFLNSGTADVRDIEVSPNPNDEGYHMVFLELDRNQDSLDSIRKIVTDMSNISGNLRWKASTHLTSEYYPLFEQDIERYFISDPDQYLSKEEWEAQVAQEEQAAVQAEEQAAQESVHNQVMEFLKHSTLKNVTIQENTIQMSGDTDEATLEFVAYGPANEVMEQAGIADRPLKEVDSVLRKFNKMLGEMRAVQIDEFIVVFNPNDNNVLVTKQC